jgi:hypothetical protein
VWSLKPDHRWFNRIAEEGRRVARDGDDDYDDKRWKSC